MKALAALDTVIHAEADHATGRVKIWMTGKDPDLDLLRERLASAGCTVSFIRVEQGSDDSLPE